MKVTIGVSNRHVHLTEESYNYLFNNKKIEKRNDLNQKGEFASTDTVDLEYNGKIIEHIRVLGPFRTKNQIELLASDLEFLNLSAPTRRSGVLEDTPTVTLINGSNHLESDGVIRAERHVHVPSSDEEELDLHERDTVKIITPDAEFTAKVKVSPNAYFEVHIDKDEAREYNLNNHDEVELEKIHD